MISSGLRAEADKLPKKPGVYLFLDATQKVLYVGKAKDLRARVRQYILGQDSRKHVALMMRKAVHVDVALTETEKEALILENTLIKRHLPRYNIQLRDDKNFLHIALDPRHPWPRFRLIRKIEKAKNHKVYGPFSSAQQARKTLAFIERSFPLRTCTDRTLRSRKRPCLLHQMHRCVAPCVDGYTDETSYGELVEEALLFLEGRHGELIGNLQRKMQSASDEEDFERAARIRDLIRSVEATLQRQQVVDTDLGNRDVWGFFRETDAGCVVVLPVRSGRMLEPLSFVFDRVVDQDAQVMSSAILQFYSKQHVPREILLPFEPEDSDVLFELVREKKKGALRIGLPLRGKKKKLVTLANTNAEARFRQKENAANRREQALSSLATHCGLSSPPHRIECYDNSNFQGDAPVASQVVFIDGLPAKKLYRKYHIKSVVGPDDFASMAEVLGRRIRRAWEENDFPDLLVVDGGKGQLSAAQECLAELGADHLPIIALAKARTEKRRGQHDAVDKLIVPGRSEAIVLHDADPALNLLRHLRDESHRFALRFHRQQRKKKIMRSVLDEIDGVGPKRKKLLLRHFGSLAGIRKSTLDELSSVEGISKSLAIRIHEALSA